MDIRTYAFMLVCACEKNSIHVYTDALLNTFNGRRLIMGKTKRCAAGHATGSLLFNISGKKSKMNISRVKKKNHRETQSKLIEY